MPRSVFNVAAHHEALQQAGLTSIEAFRNAGGEFIKNHQGQRDIIRLRLANAHGGPIILYLKRNLVPIRKHAWQALLRHGRFISSSEHEWNNLQRLQAAGVSTCRPVAVGAEFGAGGETFSFIATEAAAGIELETLAQNENDYRARCRISAAVASTLRRVHDAGIGLPTVFGRHLFIAGDPRAGDELVVTLIDLDRIKRPLMMSRRKARDLGQLHLSVPRSAATVSERLRFLRAYAGRIDRAQLERIERMSGYLLRKKHNLAKTYRGE